MAMFRAMRRAWKRRHAVKFGVRLIYNIQKELTFLQIQANWLRPEICGNQVYPDNAILNKLLESMWRGRFENAHGKTSLTHLHLTEISPSRLALLKLSGHFLPPYYEEKIDAEEVSYIEVGEKITLSEKQMLEKKYAVLAKMTWADYKHNAEEPFDLYIGSLQLKRENFIKWLKKNKHLMPEKWAKMV